MPAARVRPTSPVRHAHEGGREAGDQPGLEEIQVPLRVDGGGQDDGGQGRQSGSGAFGRRRLAQGPHGADDGRQTGRTRRNPG